MRSQIVFRLAGKPIQVLSPVANLDLMRATQPSTGSPRSVDSDLDDGVAVERHQRIVGYPSLCRRQRLCDADVGCVSRWLTATRFDALLPSAPVARAATMVCDGADAYSLFHGPVDERVGEAV